MPRTLLLCARSPSQTTTHSVPSGQSWYFEYSSALIVFSETGEPKRRALAARHGERARSRSHAALFTRAKHMLSPAEVAALGVTESSVEAGKLRFARGLTAGARRLIAKKADRLQQSPANVGSLFSGRTLNSASTITPGFAGKL
jgi:hypothetical protein